MTLRVRDVTNTTHRCEVPQQDEFDARSRALIDGVTTETGEWLPPQAIVGITVVG